MARLQEHTSCPNPVQWGCSPVKTVYIRETDPDTNKTKWLPVGWICTGCGVFRSKSGWFPSGKADPLCEARKPGEEAPTPEALDLGALPCATCGNDKTCERTYFHTNTEGTRYVCERWQGVAGGGLPEGRVLNKTYRFHHLVRAFIFST